jgi:hypothetical protein
MLIFLIATILIVKMIKDSSKGEPIRMSVFHFVKQGPYRCKFEITFVSQKEKIKSFKHLNVDPLG